jgi:hypothetical protein
VTAVGSRCGAAQFVSGLATCFRVGHSHLRHLRQCVRGARCCRPHRHRPHLQRYCCRERPQRVRHRTELGSANCPGRRFSRATTTCTHARVVATRHPSGFRVDNQPKPGGKRLVLAKPNRASPSWAVTGLAGARAGWLPSGFRPGVFDSLESNGRRSCCVSRPRVHEPWAA